MKYTIKFPNRSKSIISALVIERGTFTIDFSRDIFQKYPQSLRLESRKIPFKIAVWNLPPLFFQFIS